MNSNYYRAILQDDWESLPEQAAWLAERCDSQLEIAFGLALIREYCQLGFNYNSDDEMWCYLTDEAIMFVEPFAASPDQNGVSVAYLKPQTHHNGRVWDFGIFIGYNNGSEFDECELWFVIDIDGYGVHRQRREHDAAKQATSDVIAIRVLEESYLTLRDAAEEVLLSTICAPETAIKTKLVIYTP
jgi:hypothetical protein